MRTPRVSVVVPNYNHARHLALRLDSILDQTFQDFEVIYLDDASTDDSAEVFSAYAGHPRIRAVQTLENSGNPSIQWNRGVRMARGEYVWIAESDDFADPRFLEVLVERLDTHPGAGLAYCQSWQTDVAGRDIRTYAFHTEALDPQRWLNDFVNAGIDECRRYLSKLNTLPNASAVLFRRRLYEAVKGADETLAYCADWLLWFRILMLSDVVFVAEPLNHYRRHEGAFSYVAGLDIAGSVYALHKTLVADYPDLMGWSLDGRQRPPSELHYALGRLALNERRPSDARRHFRKSVLLRPNASSVLYYGASFLGPAFYRSLDGLKGRLFPARRRG